MDSYSKPLLRVAMSLVFLYFGFQQITNPSEWIGFVPEYALIFNLTASNLVVINAILELTLGFLLLIGLFTKISSLILAIHLFFIAISIGFNPLGIRDFGLAIATLAIFLNGIDDYCLDKKWQNSYLI